MRRLAFLLALLATGCGGSESRLTVFAAASLADVLPRIDPSPRYSFAGSGELAAQIREGAPADVYASASPAYPKALHEEGLVEAPAVFATNRLVIVVPRANPARIASLADLDRTDVKLVLGAEGVPVGDYARELLRDLGADPLLARVVSEEDDASSVAGKVALGEADAGFVYATDARAVAGRVRVIELPAQPTIEYAIAVVRDSDRGRAFVARVLGPVGRAALREAGFGAP